MSRIRLTKLNPSYKNPKIKVAFILLRDCEFQLEWNLFLFSSPMSHNFLNGIKFYVKENKILQTRIFCLLSSFQQCYRVEEVAVFALLPHLIMHT